MEEGEVGGGTSLALTPTWAVASVVIVMVALGFFFQASLEEFGKWLDRTKRKALLAALGKIKEELMVFGLLSLLMGHWIVVVAKICVKSSALSSRFYPCAIEDSLGAGEHLFVSNHTGSSSGARKLYPSRNQYCPEGRESFASQESLEQLHRLLFVLGVTHISYSFFAIALAMIKIYSWTKWENQAKSIAIQSSEGSPEAVSCDRRMRRLSTFISHRSSHPWSRHRVLVWPLSFSRQFWGSIHRADYMALRLGFITTHELPLTYDFHGYMLRSMEEEFRDIVGISVPLWVYAIACVFLDFHGTEAYFWLSFVPAILVLAIGMKLHQVVVKLAVEIMDCSPTDGNHQFNLRDELFWFGNPRILLRLIQFISFQNAFEMASFLWSLWEIKESTCFMDNRIFVGIRLISGLLTQFWCSFVTFPLYVIVTQMGARFKRTIVSEHVWQSLDGWQRRVKAKHGSSTPSVGGASAKTLHSRKEGRERTFDSASMSSDGNSARLIDTFKLHLEASSSQATSIEILDDPLLSCVPYELGSPIGNDDDNDNDNEDNRKRDSRR